MSLAQMFEHHFGAFEQESVGSPRGTSSAQLRAADVVVYLLIVGLAALQFVFYQRGAAFYSGDTTYIDLARSILRDGVYGFNFRHETMIPPGFPFIVATVCATIGCGRAVLVRSMSIFVALGFIATYELFRREHGRAVAAGICLLVGSSPIIFSFSTRTFFSDLPYFCTSMFGLFLATRLDGAKDRWGGLAASCGVFLAASVLIRSSGIALIAGLLVWLIVSFLFNRPRAAIRLTKFAPVLAAGIIVQALWMQWGTHNAVPAEWPLGGYPRSYLSQLTVKDGNDPELGPASLADLPARVGRNLVAQASEVVELVTRKGCCRTLEWFSPWVFCPLLLILVGLGTSVANSAGRWYDWYFMVYAVMYLVWPWNLEQRFYVPVAPLACLYLWRGATALFRWTAQKPRVVSGLGLLATTLCGAAATLYLWRSTDVYFRHDNVATAAFWGLSAVLTAATWLEPDRVVALLGAHSSSAALGRKSSIAVRLAGLALFVVAVGVGVVMQLELGRDNLKFDVTRLPGYPEIEAASWIRRQTPVNSVVMARDTDVVYYYTDRKVVWFPPISNPQVLMDGIRKHGAQYIVVVDRGEENSYWQPSEALCFKRLLVSFPMAFQLVHQGPRERVFEVVSVAAPASSTSFIPPRSRASA